jgi:hypothetical protein
MPGFDQKRNTKGGGIPLQLDEIYADAYSR